MIKQEQLNEMFQPIIGTTLNEISFAKEYVKLVFYGQSLDSKVELEIEGYDVENYADMLCVLNRFDDFKITDFTAFVNNASQMFEAILYLHYLTDVEDIDSEERRCLLIKQCVVKANAIVWQLFDNNITRTVMRN
jgi:hypothetical protein